MSGPLLILWTPTAAALLQGENGLRCLPAQQIRQDRAWLLALTAQGDAPTLWPLPKGRLALVEGKSGIEVRVGETARLTAAPAARHWDWAWSPTLGPVQLTLYVERTKAELGAWLKGNLPDGYFVAADTSVRSGESDDAWIATADGALTFSHGYHRVDESVYARDAFLLRRATDGSLGELTFDLFDGDYGVLCASGYSCGSLTDYLGTDPSPSRHWSHRWNTLKKLTITVPPDAETDACVRRELNRYVGNPAETSLGALFEQTPIERLPRFVTVRLPRGRALPSRDEWNPSGKLVNRVRWRWLERAEDDE